MSEMTNLLIATVAIGAALAGLILTTTRGLRQDMRGLRQDMAQLGSRLDARIEVLEQRVARS